MTAIRSEFTAALDRFDLRNQTVLVAVSGGIDSTTLLHLLCHERADRNLSVHVAHVDHSLRDESTNDAVFVENLAHAVGSPFHTCRVDARDYAAEHGCGIEAAARHLRYAFLMDTARRIGAASVLTGHTADDVIETVLMHLARGGSVRALAGIPAERPLGESMRVLRPMLDIPRSDIERYACDNRFEWVDDASNRDSVHVRNRVRHNLLPVMRSVFGDGIGPNILRFARTMGYLAPLIENMARAIQGRLVSTHPDGTRLDLEVLSSHPRIVVEHLLRDQLRMGSSDRERLLSLVHADVGVAASLSGSRMATRDRGFIAISAIAETPSLGSDFIVSIADGAYEAGPQTLTTELCDGQPPDLIKTRSSAVAIDVDKISGPLHCRPWRRGDRVQLSGLSGTKLVSDVLRDAKIVHSSRGSVHVLADEQGILWICGVRQADRAKCSNDTVRYLHCRMD